MSNTKRATARPKAGNGKPDAATIAALEAEVAEPLEAEVERAVAKAQAKFEGADGRGTVEFYGKIYRLAPKVGLMPMLDFAFESNRGATTGDEKAMATMRDMLVRCFMVSPPCRECEICLGREPDPDACDDKAEDGEPCGFCEACLGSNPDPDSCADCDLGDWPRFHLAALDNAAGAEDLLEVIGQVLEFATSRPTRRRSGSLPSAPNGSANSKGHSSSRVPPEAAGLIPVEDLARS